MTQGQFIMLYIISSYREPSLFEIRSYDLQYEQLTISDIN